MPSVELGFFCISPRKLSFQTQAAIQDRPSLVRPLRALPGERIRAEFYIRQDDFENGRSCYFPRAIRYTQTGRRCFLAQGGKVITKVDPLPRSLATSTLPPCISTNALTMLSPRPRPRRPNSKCPEE